MASYATHTLEYVKLSGGPDKVTDVHIKFSGPVEVVGVDGVAPDDPAAAYTLEGDGTDEIDVSGIDVDNFGTVDVRVKSPSDGAPGIDRQQSAWTKGGRKVMPPTVK